MPPSKMSTKGVLSSPPPQKDPYESSLVGSVLTAPCKPTTVFEKTKRCELCYEEVILNVNYESYDRVC